MIIAMSGAMIGALYCLFGMGDKIEILHFNNSIMINPFRLGFRSVVVITSA